VKERVCEYPFAAIVWVFLDPDNEKDNKFIRLASANFDRRCMDMLAACGQLEKLESKTFL